MDEVKAAVSNKNNNHTPLATQQVDTEEKQHHAFDDNWKLDVTVPFKPPVPNFMRLFIFNRIFKSIDKSTKIDVEKLVSAFSKNNKQKTMAQDIISNLIKYGIKSYMNKFYKESQSSMIEKIFDEIISQHDQFGQEYKKITTYSNINNDENNKESRSGTFYQNLLFNTSDLMHLIFQFGNDTSNIDLSYISESSDADLDDFSLVCSHWFYYAFHPNSIYTSNLTQLVKCEFNSTLRAGIRIWQRFINTRNISIDLDDGGDDDDSDDDSDNDDSIVVTPTLLARFAMLNNVERLHIDCLERDLIALQMIVQNCGSRIKSLKCNVNDNGNDYDFDSDEDDEDDIDDDDDDDAVVGNYVDSERICNRVLSMMNVEQVYLGAICLPIIFSHKCKRLVLEHCCLSQEWCDFIIDKCDCCGIEYLDFKNNSFFMRGIKNKTLINFGKKFAGLKVLNLETYDVGIVYFLQGLKEIIIKNDVRIHTTKARQDIVSPPYDEYVKIRNIEITRSLNVWKIFMQSTSVHKYLESIAITIASMSMFDQFIGLLDDRENQRKYEFLSLNKIKIECYNLLSLNDINQFLKLSLIQENLIFANVDCNVNYVHIDDFKQSFEQLCSTIYRLIVKKSLPIDIKICFDNASFSKSSFEDYRKNILLKIFNQDDKELLNWFENSQARSNTNNWIPLARPSVSIDTDVFRIANVAKLV